MRVVAYGPASAVAEPHDRIVLFVEGEEELFDLQFLVEVEPLDLADLGTGLRPAERDAEYAAAYRGHPQRVRRRLAQRVDEPHLLGDAEAVNPPVGIGVVVQPVAVGADPQQVAAACGESVDRVVQQLAVGRGNLFDMGCVEGFSVVEIGDTQQSFAFGAHPQAAFVVDVERTHWFRKVVGQVVEGDRTESHRVACVLVKSLPVGADPYDFLPGIAQQCHDAAGDVDMFSCVFYTVLRGGFQADDAVGAERHEVIVPVADDARHLSHGGQLLTHILYIYDLTAFDVELVEHMVPVDEINPVPFAECEFRERRQGYLLCFPELDVPLPVGGNFHRHTENTLA